MNEGNEGLIQHHRGTELQQCILNLRCVHLVYALCHTEQMLSATDILGAAWLSQ